MTVPLVLIPGMMCDARLFRDQVTGLADAARMWVAEPVEHATIYGLAKSVLASAPFERFALCGLSMGGIVAMEVWRQASERILGLALLDTNHREEAPDRRAGRMPQIERVLDGRLREVVVDEMKGLYLAEAGPRSDELRPLALDMALELGPLVFERQSIALRDRRDSTETLRGMDVPALVLCGEEDALCPVERHEEMAALLPQGALDVVPGAGHLTTLEQPDLVNTALRGWLARVEAL